MKLTKFTQILFATIAFSVIAHFLLRKNILREGNQNQSDESTSEQEQNEEQSNEEQQEVTEESSEETNEPVEECKAFGEAGNFDEDCKAKSYLNNDFSTNCAVYGGKTAGDVACRTSCCGNKSSSKLQENLEYTNFKKQVDECQDADHENEKVCRAIDQLAESRATNMILRERENTEDYQPYDTYPDNAQTSTVQRTTQCQPDRASAFTREANVSTGLFTHRPAAWPFPKNSNNYDNHLTGCNCPPCKVYKNPHQVL